MAPSAGASGSSPLELGGHAEEEELSPHVPRHAQLVGQRGLINGSACSGAVIDPPEHLLWMTPPLLQDGAALSRDVLDGH
jgi:hypothetical protein